MEWLIGHTNMRILIAIGVVVVLLAIFFISYVANKKTPLPEGCENIKIDEENCLACHNVDCSIKRGFDLKKLKEELKEDK